MLRRTQVRDNVINVTMWKTFW